MENLENFYELNKVSRQGKLAEEYPKEKKRKRRLSSEGKVGGKRR